MKRCLEICERFFFIGEKDKLTNKRNDKKEDADSLSHNTTSLPNLKILGLVVLEKSLTEKKVYTQTNKT